MDSTISGLSAASALTGSEPFPVDQSGSTLKATANQIKSFVNALPLLIGSQANTTKYPTALEVLSDVTTADVENHMIGFASERTATFATNGSTPLTGWGIGVYGKGWTNGGARSGGVVGEGMVTSSTDTGSAIGVRGYSLQTHAGGTNIGVCGIATGGSSNFDFYSLNGTMTSATGTLSVSSLLNATGINSTPIGATEPSTGAFTSLSASGNTVLTSTGTTLTLNRPNAAFCMQFNGGGFAGSLVGASAADTFTVGKASNGATMMELSASGLAVTGNTSTTGRALVGTTTDDGVNALQVNGTIAVGKGRISPVTATTGITTTPTSIYTVGSSYCSVLKVFITDSATHSALDVIAVGSGGVTVTVMTSANLVGVSPARVYTIASNIVKVSIASTTCNARVIADEFI